MRYQPVVLVVVAACLLARPVGAGDSAPLQLADLLDEAERASPQLAAMRARVEAAEIGASAREALPDPTLSTVYTNDGLTSFTLGSSEFTNLTVSWEQEVPGRSVRGSSAAVAHAQANALQAGSATASARLRARVITLFAELWRLDRTRVLLVESRALLTTAAEAAGARYESGEGIQEGLIRARIAVRRLDVEIEELALERRTAELALGEALGRANDPEFGPAGELPDLAEPIDVEGLTAAGAASSPEVREYVSRERAAEVALDDARVQVKSTYSWMAAYQFRGGLDPMVMGGFSVKLPVWKDRKQERAIAAAEIERTAAVREREETELRASAGTRGRAAETASLDLRLRLYREAIVPQSMAAFESANAAFGSGRAEMFLVLDDLDRWTGARRDELTLSARRVEAIASLEAMTGTTLFAIPGSGRSQ